MNSRQKSKKKLTAVPAADASTAASPLVDDAQNIIMCLNALSKATAPYLTASSCAEAVMQYFLRLGLRESEKPTAFAAPASGPSARKLKSRNAPKLRRQ